MSVNNAPPTILLPFILPFMTATCNADVTVIDDLLLDARRQPTMLPCNRRCDMAMTTTTMIRRRLNW